MSVDAPRPSDVAHYRYDAAGNPVDRAELGFPVTNSFNNLNQIVSGVWTGSTLTVAGAVNYPTGSVAVNGIGGTIYPDGSFAVTNVPVSLGTNSLTAVYNGPAYTNVPTVATDTVSVVLANSSYTYDANGNLTSDATFIYQYDTANQLTNVVRKANNTRVLSCRYDALGRRVEAIRADGTVDRYVYFPGSFLVLAVLDENNACKEFYTRGPDLSGTLDAAGGIGGILACTYASGPVLYHHADLMGNIIVLTSSSSLLVSTFCHTPFGHWTPGTFFKDFRYLVASKEWDRETDLVYYGYRYYAPSYGQWTTRDPLNELGGDNVYVAFANNPCNMIDALGLMSAYYKTIEFAKWKKQGCDEVAIHRAGREASIVAAELTRDTRKPTQTIIRGKAVVVSTVGVEYGGGICCRCSNGEVYTTGPISGQMAQQNSNTWADEAPPFLTPFLACDEGDVLVGFYHSHPRGKNSFSQNDVDLAAGNRIPLYLQSVESLGDNPLVYLPYGEFRSTLINTPNGTAEAGPSWIGNINRTYEVDEYGNLKPRF